MPDLILKIKPYIQPFERKLAFMELKAILNSDDPEFDCLQSSEISISCSKRIKVDLIDNLTYWESVVEKDSNYTKQVLREATVNTVRNGISIPDIAKILPFKSRIITPNRRCLRYATHGIHEYKGKFFPQLVRSLINIGRNKRGPLNILDPMCGSGTTILESIIDGHNVTGIDMNPLSVFITRAKCAILKQEFSSIEEEYYKLRNCLLKASPLRSNSELSYFLTLPEKDQAYLRLWFAGEVLFDLDQIMGALEKIENSYIRDFFKVSLSNILRKVSWQKNDDLRVRKDVQLDAELDSIKEFLEEVGRSVRTCLAFKKQTQHQKYGNFDVRLGNVKDVLAQLKRERKKFDMIITSPPYATALPYLDTDRLSLSFLKLLPRDQYKSTDIKMIGNREISESTRRELWSQFIASEPSLPGTVSTLINKIKIANDSTDAGFRRKNLPALLGKYFIDMREVFQQLHKLVKPNAYVFFVVGDNFTIAGGQRININTIDLLRDISIDCGFEFDECIEMEMLTNRNVHKANATKSESIMVLRNGSIDSHSS